MENNKELSGYITEKILNAFLAGCVPCYQGDPEVTRWIPADTLSPWKESRTGRNWSGAFKASRGEEIRGYRERGRRFLGSSQSQIFDSATWVAKVSDAVESLLEKRARDAKGG